MLVGLEDIRIRGGVDEGSPGGIQDDACTRGLRGLENGGDIAGATVSRERPADRADIAGREHGGEELGAAGPHLTRRGLPGLVEDRHLSIHEGHGPARGDRGGYPAGLHPRREAREELANPFSGRTAEGTQGARIGTQLIRHAGDVKAFPAGALHDVGDARRGSAFPPGHTPRDVQRGVGGHCVDHAYTSSSSRESATAPRACESAPRRARSSAGGGATIEPSVSARRSGP